MTYELDEWTFDLKDVVGIKHLSGSGLHVFINGMVSFIKVPIEKTDDFLDRYHAFKAGRS